ncbi:MAG: CYTH domain-containing protein [Oscillospiraceae bacterium]|nr:CYTH domain-containing protein [Oscillospiraceae bacterium]
MEEQYRRSVEREVKIMLTREQYDRIFARFDWDETARQTNHYYMDGKGLLRAEKINLRVREKNGKYMLQVKSLVKNEKGGPSIHNEAERETDCAPEQFSAGEVKELTGIDTDGAQRIGCLTTVRSTLQYNGEIEICLDKSEYLGLTDWELEIEYTGDRLEDVLSIVRELGLSADKKPKGKMSRFYARYKALDRTQA